MSRSHDARRHRALAARALSLAVCVCVLGLVDRGAAGDDTIARGRAIAEVHCAVCHAIGLEDASPTRVNENTAFRRLYERYPIEMLVEAAKTGSISGHDEMPGFDFAPEDARALLAYIDSLAPDQPGYVRKPAAR